MIRLTAKEKEFLFDVLFELTKKTRYCEISDDQAYDIADPLFKKFRLELRGY